MDKTNIKNMTTDERHTLMLSMLALRLNAKNVDEYGRADGVIQTILQKAESGIPQRTQSFRERTIEKCER